MRLVGLLQNAARSGYNWQSILKIAEDEAWTAFPERIIGSVEATEPACDEESDYIEGIGASRRFQPTGKGGEWFCHFHGKGNHSSKFCEIIRKLEQQWWKREGFNGHEERSKRDGLNKRDFSYSVIGSCAGKRNPFLVTGKLNNVKTQFLVNTGAGY